MRKRDELADPNSCLNRAADDEYLFVLLGRDAAATAAILAWVAERIRLGKNKPTDPQIHDALRAAAVITCQVEERRMQEKGRSDHAENRI